MLHHLQQTRISAKEVLPEVSATLDEKFLVLAVSDLAHPTHQQTIAIVLNQAVPIAAPNNLDHVPARTAEDRFEFLNNFAVATHRAVETLQVAVDDKDQIV